jgi:hypothetical protein
MFERLIERGRSAGARRAAARLRRIEAELGSELPRGVGCEAEGERIVIFGRGLLRRYLLDQSLRALLGRLR